MGCVHVYDGKEFLTVKDAMAYKRAKLQVEGKLDMKPSKIEGGMTEAMKLKNYTKRLSERTGTPFKFVTEEQAAKIAKGYSGQPGFYDGKTAYLVEGKATMSTAVHEIFTHPFLNDIQFTNEVLYNEILEEAKNIKGIVDFVNSKLDIKTTPQNILDHEYIAKAIDLYVDNKIHTVENVPSSFIDKVKQLIYRLTEYLKRIFDLNDRFSLDFGGKITLGDIADMALYGKKEIPIKHNEIIRSDRNSFNNQVSIMQEISETSREVLYQLQDKDIPIHPSYAKRGVDDPWLAHMISMEKINIHAATDPKALEKINQQVQQKLNDLITDIKNDKYLVEEISDRWLDYRIKESRREGHVMSYWALKKAKENAEARSKMLQEYRLQQKEALNKWVGYLNNNYDYNNAFKFLMLKHLSLYHMTFLKDKGLTLVRRGKDTVDDYIPINYAAVMEVYKRHKSDNLLEQYDKIFKEEQDRIIKLLNNGEKDTYTGWRVIKNKKNDPDNFVKNVEILTAYASKTATKENGYNAWCTVNGAEGQLIYCNFHIYFDNGQPVIGLSEDDVRVEQIRGIEVGQRIGEKYNDIAEERLKSLPNNIGENWLFQTDYNRKKYRLIDKIAFDEEFVAEDLNDAIYVLENNTRDYVNDNEEKVIIKEYIDENIDSIRDLIAKQHNVNAKEVLINNATPTLPIKIEISKDNNFKVFFGKFDIIINEDANVDDIKYFGRKVNILEINKKGNIRLPGIKKITSLYINNLSKIILDNDTIVDDIYIGKSFPNFNNNDNIDLTSIRNISSIRIDVNVNILFNDKIQGFNYIGIGSGVNYILNDNIKGINSIFVHSNASLDASNLNIKDYDEIKLFKNSNLILGDNINSIRHLNLYETALKLENIKYIYDLFLIKSEVILNNSTKIDFISLSDNSKAKLNNVEEIENINLYDKSGIIFSNINKIDGFRIYDNSSVIFADNRLKSINKIILSNSFLDLSSFNQTKYMYIRVSENSNLILSDKVEYIDRLSLNNNAIITANGVEKIKILELANYVDFRINRLNNLKEIEGLSIHTINGENYNMKIDNELANKIKSSVFLPMEVTINDSYKGSRNISDVDEFRRVVKESLKGKEELPQPTKNYISDDIYTQIWRNEHLDSFSTEQIKEAIRNITYTKVNTMASRVTNDMFNKIADKYGVKVNFHSDNSPILMQKVKGVMGWFFNGEINYRSSDITLDTYIHEFTHLWLKVLGATNVDVYNSVIEKTKQFLDSDNPLAKIVNDRIEHISESDKFEEAAAIISGFISIDSVVKFIGDNNYNFDMTEFQNMFGEDIANIYNMVKGEIGITDTMETLDITSASLFDIFKVLTNDILNGNNVFELYGQSLEDLKSIGALDGYLENNVPSSPVVSLNDLKHVLVDNVVNKDMSMMSHEEKANFIRMNKTLHVNTVEGKNYWSMGGVTLEVDFDSLGRLTDASVNEIIKLYDNYRNSLHDGIKEVANKIKKMIDSGVDIKHTSDIIDNVFKTAAGNPKFNAMAKNKISEIFFDKGYTEILTIKDAIKQYPDYFGKLDINLIKGIDPLIVIHNGKPGDTAMSISLIATEKLHSYVSADSNKNIFSKVTRDLDGKQLLDKKAVNEGVLMKNSSAGITNLQLGIFLAHMHDNIPNLTINTIGTIQMSNNFQIAYTTTDEFLGSIKYMKNIKGLYNSIANKDIKNIIDNAVNGQYDNMNQSYNSQLESYYNNSTFMAESYGESIARYYKKFSELELFEKKDFIRNRMKFLEIYYKGEGGYINSTEYKLLSKLYYELEVLDKYLDPGEDKGYRYSKIAEISTAYNVQSPTVQWAIDRMVANEKTAVHKFREVNDVFKRYLKPVWDRKVAKTTGGFTAIEYGSKAFKHLFKKVKIDGHDVTLPFIYHNNHIDIKNDRTLIAKLGLTKEDLALGDFIMDQIEKQMIESFKQDIYDNAPTAEKRRDLMVGDRLEREAKKMLSTMGWKKEMGQLFVISKSSQELALGKNLKESMKRSWQYSTSDVNNIFNDRIIMDNAGGFRNSSVAQLDMRVLLALAGVSIDEVNSTENNIKYKLISKEKNDNMSTNVESIFNYILLSSLRQQMHNRDSLYIYKAARCLLRDKINLSKSDLDKKAMENLDNYLEVYYQTIIENKRVPEKIDIITSFGGINLGGIMEMGGKAISFMYLAYSPKIALKSGFFNLTKMISFALSNTLTKSELPNVSHFAKAIKIYMTDFSRVLSWGRHYQVANASMYEVINSAVQNISKRHLLNSQLGHIMNQYTDEIFRHITMVAVMLKAGTWDAHITKKDADGFLVPFYDEKKDTRMYKNGVLTEEGKAWKRDIKQDLIEEGLMVEDEENLRYGYTLKETSYFKGLSDKFQVGTYSNEVASGLTRYILGRQIIKFRRFFVDVLQNAGLGTNKNRSILLSRRIMTTDENGKHMTRFETLDTTGSIQSILNAFSILWKHNLKSLPHLKKDLSQQDKFNIARSVVWIGMLMLLKGLYGKFKDKEDQRDYLIDLHDMFLSTNVWLNLVDVYGVGGLMPVISGWGRIFRKVSTDPLDLIYYAPTGRLWKELNNILEFYELKEKREKRSMKELLGIEEEKGGGKATGGMSRSNIKRKNVGRGKVGRKKIGR